MNIYAVSFMTLLVCTTSYAQKDSVLICKAIYKTPRHDNQHAGSGFLLSYNSKVYAITAKHVLHFARTDNMKTISFGEDLEQWIFYSKRSDSEVLAGKLVNENPNETIEMPPKGDWLIFETHGDTFPDNIKVYNLRESPLKKGEKLHFLGYPYQAEHPVCIEGSFRGYTNEGNLSLDVPRGSYGGCSGGPVLDAQDNLVGIISLGYYDKEELRYIFQPASIDYFISTVKNN